MISSAVQDLELGTAMTSNDDRALIDASGGVNKTQTVIDEDGATAETNGTQSMHHPIKEILTSNDCLC